MHNELADQTPLASQQLSSRVRLSNMKTDVAIISRYLWQRINTRDHHVEEINIGRKLHVDKNVFKLVNIELKLSSSESYLVDWFGSVETA